MACTNPWRAYVGPEREPGKINVVWKRSQSWKGEELVIPCYKCLSCRLERARQWSMRCMHEASLYERNAFITLTYEDSQIPLNGSLDLRDLQLFMKRLRKSSDHKIRYFACGEYGLKLLRPHYHAILFNHEFEDKVLWSVRDGNPIYTSKELCDLWKKGFTTVGDVTPESTSYVSRYVTKKNYDLKKREDHYGLKVPEFVVMSKGRDNEKGIGFKWFEKYQKDVYPWDEVIVNGRAVKPPRYYDSCLEKKDKNLLDAVKEKRKDLSEKTRLDRDSFRLPVKNEYLESRFKLYKRTYEEEENADKSVLSNG